MRLNRLILSCLAVLAVVACGRAQPSVDAPDGPEQAASAGASEARAEAAKPQPALAAQDAEKPRAPAYAPVDISADDNPGRARRIRCQVGRSPETNCTFTPLFGDGSFQLDGPDIALRMIVGEEQGRLFEVFGPDHRVATTGIYRRDATDRACWVAEDDTVSPARVCAR